MTELRTDSKLLRALETSTQRTTAQMEQQRLSFVMGSLPNTSTMTREQVQKVLEVRNGDRKRAQR